jgi:hypothetical protein
LSKPTVIAANRAQSNCNADDSPQLRPGTVPIATRIPQRATLSLWMISPDQDENEPAPHFQRKSSARPPRLKNLT